MKKIFNALQLTTLGIFATFMASPAHATLDTSGITVDTAAFYAIAALLLGALIGFWAVKRGLGLLGR